MVDRPYTGPKMEARKSPGSYVVEVPRELEPEDLDEEARVYGSRWVEVEAADGGTSVEEVPLTWKDLFDPQEGDWLMHGPEHGDVTGDTKSSLKCLFKARGREIAPVFSRDPAPMFSPARLRGRSTWKKWPFSAFRSIATALLRRKRTRQLHFVRQGWWVLFGLVESASETTAISTYRPSKEAAIKKPRY